MGNVRLRRITLDGVMVALFLVLGVVRIRFGTFLEIGFGTLVITVVALAISPIDAFIVGFLGEFLNQILFSGYGLTPTTPLWCVPPAIRGLLIGLVALSFVRKGDALIRHKVLYFTTIMGTALFISLLDTGLLYLDGLIMGYPVAYTWAQTGIRFLTSQITAVVVALISLPLCRAVGFLVPYGHKQKDALAKSDGKAEEPQE